MTSAELDAIRERCGVCSERCPSALFDVGALLAEVDRLRRALVALKQTGHEEGDMPCVDSQGEFWSESGCTCGMVEHNAAIDAALEGRS